MACPPFPFGYVWNLLLPFQLYYFIFNRIVTSCRGGGPFSLWKNFGWQRWICFQGEGGLKAVISRLNTVEKVLLYQQNHLLK